jgi:hypothetical protein
MVNTSAMAAVTSASLDNDNVTIAVSLAIVQVRIVSRTYPPVSPLIV